MYRPSATCQNFTTVTAKRWVEWGADSRYRLKKSTHRNLGLIQRHCGSRPSRQPTATGKRYRGRLESVQGVITALVTAAYASASEHIYSALHGHCSPQGHHLTGTCHVTAIEYRTSLSFYFCTSAGGCHFQAHVGYGKPSSTLLLLRAADINIDDRAIIPWHMLPYQLMEWHLRTCLHGHPPLRGRQVERWPVEFT